MLVKFKRTYFGPDGYRYRKGVILTVPDAFKTHLPKGAEVIETPAPSVEDSEAKKTADKKSGLFSKEERAAAEA